jgi:hypothetical protein
MRSSRAASAPAGTTARPGGSGISPEPGTSALLVVLLVLILSGWALWSLPDSGSLYKLAPVQVLLGSAIFIGLISLVVLIFARLGLYDRGAALALPEGSVRALIALILLIIFIIFANVIFGRLSTEPSYVPQTFTGLTQAQVEQLPGAVTSQNAVTTTDGEEARWEGTYVIQRPSEEAANLGQQVVTGLLTLVAAISAFYFGTASVTTGASAMLQMRGPTERGGLRVLRPSQPAGLTPTDGGAYDDVEIQLGGPALNTAGVTATVQSNDAGGRVRRGNADDLVVYSPSDSATDPVTLRFASAADDRVTVDLTLHVPARITTEDPDAPPPADPDAPPPADPNAPPPADPDAPPSRTG